MNNPFRKRNPPRTDVCPSHELLNAAGTLSRKEAIATLLVLASELHTYNRNGNTATIDAIRIAKGLTTNENLSSTDREPDDGSGVSITMYHEELYPVLFMHRDDLKQLFNDKPVEQKRIELMSESNLKAIARQLADALYEGPYSETLDKVMRDYFATANQQGTTK